MPNDHGAPVTNKQAIERLKAKHDGDIPLGAILTLRNPFQVYDLIEYDWSAIRFGRKVRKKRWYVWSSGCVVCKADFTCRAQRNFFTLKRTCPEHTGQLPRAVKPKPEKIAKPPKPEKPKRKYPNADAIRQTVDEYCLVHDTMWIHAFVFEAARKLPITGGGIRDTRRQRIERALRAMIEKALIPVRIEGNHVVFLD